MVIVYAPDIMKSQKDIQRKMGVGRRTIEAWLRMGAPIAVEGEGKQARYSAEVAKLQAWREERFGKGSSREGCQAPA